MAKFETLDLVGCLLRIQNVFDILWSLFSEIHNKIHVMLFFFFHVAVRGINPSCFACLILKIIISVHHFSFSFTPSPSSPTGSAFSLWLTPLSAWNCNKGNYSLLLQGSEPLATTITEPRGILGSWYDTPELISLTLLGNTASEFWCVNFWGGEQLCRRWILFRNAAYTRTNIPTTLPFISDG